MPQTSDGAPQTPPRPSIPQTLLLLFGVIVGAGAFIWLNTLVGTSEFYVGFFFLFFWAGIQKVDFAALPSTVAGAVFGIALGLLLQQLIARFGPNGGLIFLAPVLVVLFLLLRGHLRFVINDSAMLMLTVATVAHVQAHADFTGMFISLALAVVFFGGLFWVTNWVTNRLAARTEANAPAAAPATF